MPCPYANALGTPKQGIHKVRVLGLALNDLIGTAALEGATSMMSGKTFTQNFIVWLLIAEVAHYAFGVDTALLGAVGVKPRSCGAT